MKPIYAVPVLLLALAGCQSSKTGAAASTVTVTAPGATITAAPASQAAATVTVTATATVTAQPSAAPTKAAAPGQPSDKGWTLVGLTTKNDGVGDFGGTARITNTNSGSRTGVFTITLLKGSTIVASLQGSADGATAGQTVTVDLISSDPYVTGSFTAQFQTDTSF